MYSTPWRKQLIQLPNDIEIVTTADASSPATVITLANDLKSSINKLIISYNLLLQEIRKDGAGI